MKHLLCTTTALVALLLPVCSYAAAPAATSDFLYAKKALPAATSPLSPKAKGAVQPQADSRPALTRGGPPPGIDADCRTKAPGAGFNSVHEYNCAFQFFRAYSMPLADAAKRADFEKLWAPSVWLKSDYLKTDGVADADRIKNTFALIRRMRDFTHERFDYVHDAQEAANIDKESRHPVLEGGIGAVLRMNNSWEFQKAIFSNAPAEGISGKEFMEKMTALAIIGPGHELVIDVPVRESPSDGVLKAGDIVVSVGGDLNNPGTPVAGMNQDAAVKMIRGDVGTTVVLHVLRKNSAGKMIPLALTLNRTQVEQRAIMIHDDVDGIRHIDIQNFANDHVIDDFYDAVTGAEKAGMKGIDLDVRSDPGGRIDYVTAMLEMLVPRGLILKQVMRDPGADGLTQTDTIMEDGFAVVTQKVASEPDSSKKVNAIHRVPYDSSYAVAAARNPGFVDAHPLLPVVSADMPMTVTINVNSYSASEIFAGALQATHRAVVIGEGSAGKGAIMPEISLPEGGSLDVTNGQFYPGGMDTKHKGIIPDRAVDMVKDYGETDAVRAEANAVILEAASRIQAIKQIAADRTKVNDARFEAEMAKRDAADLLPLAKLDPSREQ
jgi:C-terminal processing protease CtpA/Prc